MHDPHQQERVIVLGYKQFFLNGSQSWTASCLTVSTGTSRPVVLTCAVMGKPSDGTRKRKRYAAKKSITISRSSGFCTTASTMRCTKSRPMNLGSLGRTRRLFLTDALALLIEGCAKASTDKFSYSHAKCT